jgi:tetratricopeptide (TPR) repeat protein
LLVKVVLPARFVYRENCGEQDDMTDAIEPQKPELPPMDAEQLELKLPDESAALKDLGLWAGVLVLLTLITWWPATTGGFIWRDDATAANKELLAPSGLSQSWFGRWQTPQKSTEPVYQPLTDTAYWLEYRLGGHNEKNLPAATAFHVAGLIFHAAAAVLLWLVLRELLLPGAWMVAAIFSLDPIHAESISWISQQGTVLAGMLFLGSVYSYFMFVKSREQDAADRAAGGAGVDPAQTWGLFAGSAMLALLAMLSQPAALVAPGVILVLLWWKKRLTSLDSLLLTPLLIVGLALWFSNFDLHKTAGDAPLLHSSFGTQIATVGRGLIHSALAPIVPAGLSILYSRDASSVTTIAATLIFACVILAGIGAFLLHKPGAVAAIAIFVMLVAFSVNWFDADRLSYITDNTAYLAVVPIAAVIVGVILRLRIPGPQPQTVVGICAFVLVVLGGIGWSRSYAFESSGALWRDVLKKNPSSAFAEASLAEQQRQDAIDDKDRDDTDAMNQNIADSINHSQAALALDPNNAPAQRTWANALVAKGDLAEALPHFESATQLDPTNPILRTEYASALIDLGRFKPALPEADEALALDVKSATAHRLLGQAYAGLGDNDRAIHEQQAALDLNSGDTDARQKLAELQAKSGRLKDAIENYSLILAADQTQMSRPEIWQAIAKIKDRQGAYDFATQYLETAAKLAPEDAEIKKELDEETKKRDKAAATQPATTRAAL